MGRGRGFEEDLSALTRGVVPIEVTLVWDPDVVPQRFVIPTERSIPCDATSCGDVELDVAPDPDVEMGKCVRMEKSDEVDDEEIGARERLGIGQGPCGPVEATEGARPLLA